MVTIQLLPDYKEFLRLLTAHRVEYLLIGDYAVGYHGHPPSTVDLGVWVGASHENASRLLQVLTEFGFGDPSLTPEDLVKERQIIRMGVPPVRIEVLSSISGGEFDNCYRRRIIDTLDGVEVNIISLEHLEQTKRAIGRLRDCRDRQALS